MGGSDLEVGVGTPLDVCVLGSTPSGIGTGSGSELSIGISSGGCSDIVTLFLGLLLGIVTMKGDFEGDPDPTMLGNFDQD